MASDGPQVVAQHALDRADHAIELGAFGGELPAAGGGERVVAGAAVVLRRAPLGLHPAVEQQPLERGIQRALADLQHVVRRQAQVLDDAVAMLGPCTSAFRISSSSVPGRRSEGVLVSPISE